MGKRLEAASVGGRKQPGEAVPVRTAAVDPAISADGQAVSPAGGQDFDISTLQPCAYILWITTTLNLTEGYGKLPGEYDDHIAFCIHDAPAN